MRARGGGGEERDEREWGEWRGGGGGGGMGRPREGDYVIDDHERVIIRKGTCK